MNTMQAEPVRKIANIVVGITTAITAIIVMANQWLDILPANQKAKVSAILVTVGVIVGVVSRVAAEFQRNAVYAPDTHMEESNLAQSAVLRKP